MKTDCFCTNPLSLTQNGGPYYNPMQGHVFYVYLLENWASKAKAKVNAALGSGTGIFLMKCILVDNSVYTGTTEVGRSIKGRIWQVYCSST